MGFNNGLQFKKLLKASKNHEICPVCKGTGEMESLYSVAEFVPEDCNLCNGKGEVDWVTYLRYKGSGIKIINNEDLEDRFE